MFTLELDTAGVVARGMVVSVLDADAVCVPDESRPVSKDAEQFSVLLPSALWPTFTVFVIMTWEPVVVLLVLKVMPEKEYFVPSIVIVPVHFFVPFHEPYVQEATTSTVTFDVLFAIFWLFWSMDRLILTAI
jgi:hypothetical protein